MRWSVGQRVKILRTEYGADRELIGTYGTVAYLGNSQPLVGVKCDLKTELTGAEGCWWFAEDALTKAFECPKRKAVQRA